MPEYVPHTDSCYPLVHVFQIAKAVELEVARRLEEERALERQRREEEATAAVSRSTSMREDSHSQDSSLQSLPSGLLTPLLKSSRDSHEDELKRRLDELEARLCDLFFSLASRRTD